MNNNTKSARRQVTIYIDGKTEKNPGPGAWSSILTFGVHKKELNGYQADTEVFRMQLFAAISGLGALKEPCIVQLVTKSTELVADISQQKYIFWRANGWKEQDGSNVQNKDLWFILGAQLQKHEVHPVKLGNAADINMARCAELVAESFQEYIDINTVKEENDNPDTTPGPINTSQPSDPSK